MKILISIIIGLLILPDSVIHGAIVLAQSDTGMNSSTVFIMPLGNSITQAEEGSNSYRRPLWKLLNNAGYKVDFVGSLTTVFPDKPHPDDDFDHDHEGHWGWRTDEIINGRTGEGKLSEWLLGYSPDIALIHLGTNDLLQRRSITSVINNLENIIDILRAVNPDVTVLLAQLIPTSYSASAAEDIIELNSQLPGITTRKSQSNSKILIVDHHSGFNVSDHTYDNLHPNLEGENLMAAKWFEALEGILTPSTVIERQKVVSLPSLYPNPAIDYINISGPDIYILAELYCLSGKLLIRKEIKNEGPFQLNISELKSGAYFIRIINLKDESSYLKMLKTD